MFVIATAWSAVSSFLFGLDSFWTVVLTFMSYSIFNVIGVGFIWLLPSAEILIGKSKQIHEMKDKLRSFIFLVVAIGVVVGGLGAFFGNYLSSKFLAS